jgi:Sec-independent protein secretion pathway component TatC
MLLETVPLIALYELSLVLARAFGTTPNPIPTIQGGTP